MTAEKPVPTWRKFLAQFQDVLVILLLIATLINEELAGEALRTLGVASRSLPKDTFKSKDVDE